MGSATITGWMSVNHSSTPSMMNTKEAATEIHTMNLKAHRRAWLVLFFAGLVGMVTQPTAAEQPSPLRFLRRQRRTGLSRRFYVAVSPTTSSVTGRA